MSPQLGDGHFTGITAWLAFIAQCVVTAMVAVSFRSYASPMFTDGDAAWSKMFTVLLLLVMGTLNVPGPKAGVMARGVVVRVVLAILLVFCAVTLFTADWSLVAPSGYPTLHKISSSVALTFFANLGFVVITFTAKDLSNPSRQLPRAVYVAIAIASAIYIALAMGVYGRLTVPEVINAGDTAVAKAAKPAFGNLGYARMASTALFSTAGASNSGLSPAAGLFRDLAASRSSRCASTATGRVGRGGIWSAGRAIRSRRGCVRTREMTRRGRTAPAGCGRSTPARCSEKGRVSAGCRTNPTPKPSPFVVSAPSRECLLCTTRESAGL